MVFASESSFSTFKHVWLRSIWRISPHRTLPGPTSTNVVTPAADRLAHGRFPLNCAGNLADQRIARAIGTVDNLGVDVGDQLVLHGAEGERSSILLQAILRWLHQCAMEGCTYCGRMTARFAPFCFASSAARSTAALLPESQSGSGEMMFAAWQT